MADFSIQEAAFTGFRVVREHPSAAIVWVGVALVVSMGASLLMVALVGPALMQLQAAAASGVADRAQVVALFGRTAPLYALLVPAALIFNGVLYAAMNRVVLRPGETRFAFFGLGAAELRQIGLQLLAFVVLFGAYLAGVVAVVIVTAVVALASRAAAPAVGVVGAAALLAGMIWLLVRLSLASALTFDTGRVDLFGSFRLTRGRAWPIFGAYVLAAALTAFVFLLSWLVILAITTLASGGDLAAMMAPADMSSIGAYLSGARLVQLALGAAVSALVWPLLLTPPAVIYRQIAPPAGRERGDARRIA